MSTKDSPADGASAVKPGLECTNCSVRMPRTAPQAEAPPLGFFGEISFQDMAQIALDAIGDGVLVVDPKGKVIYLNKMAETLTGWSCQEAFGRPFEQVFFIFDETSRERVPSPAHQAIREDRLVGLALGSVLIRRDGSDIAIEHSATPIPNQRGEATAAVIIFHDARQSGAAMQKMSHLAQHDFLTGLPNRMLLTERLTQAIGMAKRRGKKIALLFVDLDYFKKINDSYGHVVGDHLLQEVATEFAACIRATDTVSRRGGDEFVILLTEVEERQDAARIAEKLLARFAAPRIIDGHKLQVSLSIGIAIYPENGDDADTLVTNADVSMYVSKESGRNTYRFCRRLREQSSVSPEAEPSRSPRKKPQ